MGGGLFCDVGLIVASHLGVVQITIYQTTSWAQPVGSSIYHTWVQARAQIGHR